MTYEDKKKIICDYIGVLVLNGVDIYYLIFKPVDSFDYNKIKNELKDYGCNDYQ